MMENAGASKTRVWQDESRLATVVTWIAAATALTVAIAAPSSYFFLSREAELRDTAMAARLAKVEGERAKAAHAAAIGSITFASIVRSVEAGSILAGSVNAGSVSRVKSRYRRVPHRVPPRDADAPPPA